MFTLYKKELRGFFFLLSIVLASCEGENESSFCHKGINIVNISNTPITIYRVWHYQISSTENVYSMRSDSDKNIILQMDTAYLDIAGWMDCLEDLIEWEYTHPNSTYSVLRTIYICDTNQPNQVFYHTIDSVLCAYNILKEINLKDSSLASLRENNYTITYP